MASRAASPPRGWAWALALAVVLVAACLNIAVAAGATHRVSAVSPLRHAVVFTRFSPGAGQGDVYRIDARGTAEHLIRAGVLDFAQTNLETALQVSVKTSIQETSKDIPGA